MTNNSLLNVPRCVHNCNDTFRGVLLHGCESNLLRVYMSSVIEIAKPAIKVSCQHVNSTKNKTRVMMTLKRESSTCLHFQQEMGSSLKAYVFSFISVLPPEDTFQMLTHFSIYGYLVKKATFKFLKDGLVVK